MRNASSRIAGSFNSLTRAPAFSVARAAASTAVRMSGLACVPDVRAHQREMRRLVVQRPSTRKVRPVIASAAKATSATLAAKNPGVSSDHEKHLIPTSAAFDMTACSRRCRNRRRDGSLSRRSECRKRLVPCQRQRRPPNRMKSRPVCASNCADFRVAAGSRKANGVVTVLPMRLPPARRAIVARDASARGRWPA